MSAEHKVASCLHVPYHTMAYTGSSSHTIGLLSRMRVVVSMRLHGLVFAAGQGVPLVGVVYDQKVSSFLSYIGQNLFTHLNDLTAHSLIAQIDAACSRIEDCAFLSEGVARLRRAESQNSRAAAELLDLSSGSEDYP